MNARRQRRETKASETKRELQKIPKSPVPKSRTSLLKPVPKPRTKNLQHEVEVNNELEQEEAFERGFNVLKKNWF